VEEGYGTGGIVSDSPLGAAGAAFNAGQPNRCRRDRNSTGHAAFERESGGRRRDCTDVRAAHRWCHDVQHERVRLDDERQRLSNDDSAGRDHAGIGSDCIRRGRVHSGDECHGGGARRPL
jgi:hypothetical protein